MRQWWQQQQQQQTTSSIRTWTTKTFITQMKTMARIQNLLWYQAQQQLYVQMRRHRLLEEDVRDLIQRALQNEADDVNQSRSSSSSAGWKHIKIVSFVYHHGRRRRFCRRHDDTNDSMPQISEEADYNNGILSKSCKWKILHLSWNSWLRRPNDGPTTKNSAVAEDLFCIGSITLTLVWVDVTQSSKILWCPCLTWRRTEEVTRHSRKCKNVRPRWRLGNDDGCPSRRGAWSRWLL